MRTMKTYERITDLIGGTPLLKLTNYNAEHQLNAVIYGKAEIPALVLQRWQHPGDTGLS